MNVAFPFGFDARGRTASADDDEHVAQLVEQVLFTAPGERVNRPTFGSGLHQLAFAPTSTELATATQFLVQGALQQWLGNLIQVIGVHVDVTDGTLTVAVEYTLRRTGARQSVQFTRSLA